MPKLNLIKTWDNIKLSECLKLLFKEIIVPTYFSLSKVEIQDWIKEKLLPKLDI